MLTCAFLSKWFKNSRRGKLNIANIFLFQEIIRLKHQNSQIGLQLIDPQHLHLITQCFLEKVTNYWETDRWLPKLIYHVLTAKLNSHPPCLDNIYLKSMDMTCLFSAHYVERVSTVFLVWITIKENMQDRHFYAPFVIQLSLRKAK